MRVIRYRDIAGSTGWANLAHSGDATALSGSPADGWQDTTRPLEPGWTLLPPVAPPAIFGIGLNYREHASETGSTPPDHPMVFMKSPGAVIAHREPIALPRILRSDKVDYEAELAIVIGRPAKNVSPAEALDYVAGFTCANDVSARDWQKEWGGGQFCRGKTFDTFCPLGPCLVTPDEIGNVQNLPISLDLNGERMQESTTADMIFPVRELVAFLSGSTTLLPGTVILTGTPPGVGMARTPARFLSTGDTVRVTIDGIGTLENPVVEETTTS